MTERLLMIPGPIETDPAVLAALARKTTSHIDPDFIETFGRALGRVREVFLAPSAQPFVVAGTGTLAMELAAQSLVEAGDAVLVLDTGVFSERMASLLERIGANVTRFSPGVGRAPDLAELERTLATGSFRAITITHVDTSTGVRAPVREIAALARAHRVLSIVDGVCSVGGEELQQDAWSVDVALTASQKALGTPPGLAVLTLSPNAMERYRMRKQRVPSLYLDLGEWLPIMQAYEARKPAYFATPAVNLVNALDVSLGLLLAEGIDARVARHASHAAAFRAGAAALGLSLVAEERVQASTISALYFPPGVDASLVAAIRDEGVVVAGGLLPAIRAQYFRVGHMGITGKTEIVATLAAIERALVRCGAKIDLGAGVGAAQAMFAKS
jgi:alanine-glyoxylate transaminase/serine-glyoxylate transaminase/serine-pyruvate transaminase